jgi:hypothetical protein
LRQESTGEQAIKDLTAAALEKEKRKKQSFWRELALSLLTAEKSLRQAPAALCFRCADYSHQPA